MKLLNSKKGLEMEVTVKAILALIVLVVLIGMFYIFVVKRAGRGIGGIVDETENEGDGMLARFRDFFGSKCEEGSTKCSLTGFELECNDNKWEKTEDECE